MAENTKLILSQGGKNPIKGELDLATDFPIVLNFNLASVQDISKRNSTYSKTVILPGTKNNRILLGHLYDINVDFEDATFPIDRKIVCQVIQNESVVLNGFFKLKSINKLSPSDVSFDEQISFEAVVFGGQGSFFDYVKDKDLDTIDLSTYIHTINASTILASSAHTYLNGYKYIWHYNSNPDGYSVGTFRPSIYVKTIWDAIFIAAGYTYVIDTTFETDIFNKLLMPSNIRDFKIGYEEQRARSAKVGFPTTGITWGFGDISSLASNSRARGYNAFSANIYNGVDNVGGGDYFTYQRVTARELYVESAPCFFDGAYDNYDNIWPNSITSGKFVVKKNGSYDFRINILGNLDLELNQAATWFIADVDNQPRFKFEYRLTKNNTTPVYNNVYEIDFNDVFTMFNTASVAGNTNGIVYNPTAGPWQAISANTTSSDINFFSEPITVDGCVSGDTFVVDMRVTLSFKSLYCNPDDGTKSINLIWNFKTNPGVCTQGYVSMSANPVDVTEGDIITLDQCLPKKTKMSEFVKSLSQMFNLYIDVDKDEPTKLIITPRPDYYQYQLAPIDWTDKIAYDNDYSIELLSELQTRTINYTWKEAKDITSQSYKNEFKILYGQFKLSFDNDFLTGENKIEPIFESTPLVMNMSPTVTVDNGKNFIVPHLEYGIDGNPKILFDGGVIYTDESYDLLNADGSIVSISQYNYAGHFDDPFKPTVDLNWNINESYKYPEIYDALTSNNLYNIYYSDYINLIQDSKLLTAFFNLNENDINTLEFNRLYWIRDAYYILNSVKDYDLVNKKLTQCEFIKSNNIPYKYFSANVVDLTSPRPPERPIKPWMNGSNSSNEMIDIAKPGITSNVNLGNGVLVYSGWDNLIGIGSNKGEVTGSGNIINEKVENFKVLGNNNKVGSNSKNITIVGTGNEIPAGAERVALINCENVKFVEIPTDVFLQNIKNKTITKNDISYVNPFVYFKDGFQVNNSDVVDGGEDMVYKTDNQFVDNVVDGMIDKVLTVGVDGAQLLDGTYDTIDY